MLAEHGDSPQDPVPAAIETSRGLLVACLRATGRPVYAINPMAFLSKRRSELNPGTVGLPETGGRLPAAGLRPKDDDRSLLACSEIPDDEKAVTCAALLRRAAAFFATVGFERIERDLTDNAWPARRR